ncbi:Hsp20/alpha crystallin family protein [Sphingobium sp. BYY-5]|uniref:Hsp20/alpha crystallin family protein n=1 Tax=Sphingobium sp. BYY-5 TaxID=2926400 RepID=UPI001FA6D493|nr:Hsp20/alpha crystallin family protein [Sphingobium sp. BYY-5]MCI4592475.1 Hsp20/alpha crystallin family protein [Sphingobium sp. BYY-5]
MNEMIKTPPARTPANSLSLAEDGPMGWLRGEIDRLFDDLGGPVPALELTDGGKAYRLTAELPGLADKDVQIEVADGVLTISGEKREESEHKDDGFLLSERRYGSFKRQIALPADVDADAIKAKFKHGVLSLTLGKDEKAAERSRKIAIES